MSETITGQSAIDLALGAEITGNGFWRLDVPVEAVARALAASEDKVQADLFNAFRVELQGACDDSILRVGCQLLGISKHLDLDCEAMFCFLSRELEGSKFGAAIPSLDELSAENVRLRLMLAGLLDDLNALSIALTVCDGRECLDAAAQSVTTLAGIAAHIKAGLI